MTRWEPMICVAVLAGCLQTGERYAPPTAATTDGEPTLAAVFTPPAFDTIPEGERGDRIRLGYELVVHTQDHAKNYVGNGLSCTNCHVDAGLDPNAASFIGLSRLYPEYRPLTGWVMTLADRINECFERSLNGTPLPKNSRQLTAIVAYIDWLSQDVPTGMQIQWRGIPPTSVHREPDYVRGEQVFAVRCAYCHGADGQGTFAAPAVWGATSYTIGAAMARNTVAASFIKANMPRTRGWALSDDEAYDVAAYVNSKPRPDFPGKDADWPKGDKPSDVPY